MTEQSVCSMSALRPCMTSRLSVKARLPWRSSGNRCQNNASDQEPNSDPDNIASMNTPSFGMNGSTCGRRIVIPLRVRQLRKSLSSTHSGGLFVDSKGVAITSLSSA